MSTIGKLMADTQRRKQIVRNALKSIPSYKTLDAIDDDDYRGTRPLPVTLTLGQWRAVRETLERGSR